MIRNALLNKAIWNKVAIVDGDSTIRYGELARKALSLRKYLPSGTDEHIAILLPNNSDYVVALFGTLMAGMIAVPVNPALTHHEINALLEQTKTSSIISSRCYKELLDEVEIPIVFIEDVITSDDYFSSMDINPNSPMVFLNTSGTTGNSKIVMLSERNVDSSVQHYNEKMVYDIFEEEEIRYVMAIPFTSIYGLLILGVIVSQGFTLVLMQNHFTLDSFYKTIEQHRITHTESGTIALILMEQNLERPNPYDLSSVYYYGCGGSGISKEALLHLSEAMPNSIFWIGYGMTEASPLISKPDKVFPLEKLSSVGVPGKDMEVMIEVNGEKTNTPYTEGEIVAKGPNIMLGYYENKVETAKIIRNGWLYTGDIGYFDDDNYLYILGRKKNVILVRGFTVYAEEVEACLLDSGFVLDCFVYGKQDVVGNEQLHADVVLKSGDIDALYTWNREHLTAYKQPHRIHLCDEIQRNSSGKIERAVK